MKTLPLKRFVDPSRPITYGIVQAGPDFPGGVPYIRPVDMRAHGGVPDPSLLLRTSPEIAASYRRSEVREGDIVVSIGPSFGKTMLVPADLDGANLTQGTARVAPRRGTHPRFLIWALQSRLAIGHWESSVGGATFRALNLGPLSTTPIPSISLSEQRAIADFLDRETARIDALLTKKEALISALGERHACLERMKTLDNQYSPVALRWYVRVSSGESLSSEEFVEDGPTPVIGGNGVMGYTDKPGFVKTPSIAVGRVGALCGNVHFVDPPAWVTDNALWVRDVRGFKTGYLVAALRSADLNSLADRTAQPLITSETLKRLRIPAPPIETQADIVQSVRTHGSRLHAVETRLTAQIGLLQAHRQALITAAVTSQLDVSAAA